MPDHDRPGASERKTQQPGAISNGADWREQAACRHVDPDLFFPVGTTGPTLRQIDEAKRICQACPVRTPCLAWALEHNIAAGVWGATTEEERHAIRQAVTRPRNQT